MAPRPSRPHPYRATSDVETPSGIRLPAGIEPPPDRPILIIVDYSPLQELTHPSERDHELYSVLANHNFRCTTAGELEALFTWTRYMFPDEADSIQFSQLRPSLVIRLRTQWGIQMVASDLEFRYADLTGDVSKYVMTGLSNNFWRNIAPNGASDSTTTSNPLC